MDFSIARTSGFGETFEGWKDHYDAAVERTMDL